VHAIHCGVFVNTKLLSLIFTISLLACSGGSSSSPSTQAVQPPNPTVTTAPTADNITVNIDGTFTETEKQWVLTFTRQLAYVLNNLTGTSPAISFNLTYDPSYHKSWNNDLTILQASSKQLTDPHWASWFVVEVSHKYIPQYTNFANSSDITLFRTNEYNAQAMTAAVCYSMKGSLFANNFSENEARAYAELVGILEDPGYSLAYNHIKSEIVESAYPNNYNGMNSISCDEAVITYGALFKADPLFWQKFFSAWSRTNWVGRAGYQQLVASVAPTTMYGVPTMQWLSSRHQFAANPVQSSISVTTLDLTKGRAYSRHDLSTLNPTHFAVLGQSLFPVNGLPDPLLFGQTITATVSNSVSNAVVWTGSASVLTNLDNALPQMPSLAPGSYTLQVSIVSHDTVLTDSINFTK